MSALWTSQDFVEAIQGRPFGSLPDHVSGISIDTRTLLAEGGRYDDLANKNRLGGYATVDLRAAYQLDADWRVEGVLTNVFDHDYETARFYVQEGRAVFVTLKYQPAR